MSAASRRMTTIVTVIATRDHSCGTHGALVCVRDVGGVEAAKARAWKALCGLEWWVDAPSSTHNSRELPAVTTNDRPDAT